jgi:hypothetical protein
MCCLVQKECNDWFLIFRVGLLEIVLDQIVLEYEEIPRLCFTLLHVNLVGKLDINIGIKTSL